MAEKKQKFETWKDTLTDGFVKGRKVEIVDDVPTKRDYWDNSVRGLGLHVSAAGTKTFIQYLRWPGEKFPARRPLGDYPVIDLKTARQIARDNLALVEQGKDPKVERQRVEQKAIADRAILFSDVVDDYIKEDLAGKKRADKDQKEIVRHILPVLGDVPVAHINQGHILELAKGLKSIPATGRLVLSHLKRIYAWALHEHDKVRGNRYGLTVDPAAGVKPKRVFGEKVPDDRYLDDAELAAAWRALDRLANKGNTLRPETAALRLIFYTGMRRDDASKLTWKAVDFDQRYVLIEAVAFKSKVRFAYPLSDPAVTLLRALHQQRDRGPFVFSNHGGTTAIDGWSNFMNEVWAIFVEELGHEPDRWSPHPVRHTVRTAFDRLKVPENVAELAIGHVKKGLVKTYSHYLFLDERREAFDKWADLLHSIVAPKKPGKVTNITAAKKRKVA